MSIWSTYSYPFNLIPQAGKSSLWYRSPSDLEYQIQLGDSILGTASPVDLTNGFDAEGELYRLPRRSKENDYSYIGRLQRGLITASNGTISGTENHHCRVLSSILGYSTISSQWNGLDSSTLPVGTTFLDIIGDPGFQEDSLYYSNKSNEIIPLVTITSSLVGNSLSSIQVSGLVATPLTSSLLSYTSNIGAASGTYCAVFKTSIDLTSYLSLRITLDQVILLPGIDYLINLEDPSVLILRKPILITGPKLQIQVSGFEEVRVSYQEDNLHWGVGRAAATIGFESLPATYKAFCSSIESGVFNSTVISDSTNYYPLTILELIPLPARTIAHTQELPERTLHFGQNIRTQGLPRIENRLLRLPGGSLLTALGLSILENLSNTSWNTTVDSNSSSVIPLDLDSIDIPFNV